MARRTLLCLVVLSLPFPVLAQEEDPPTVKARVAEICERVEALRGLEFKADVQVGIMGTDELREFMASELDREMPESEMEAARLSMVALGLLPEGADLRDLLVSIYTSQVAGFYDPRTKRLYLIKGNGTDEALLEALGKDEEVWIHELTHALDDQHFDLQALGEKVEEHDDASLAGSMLCEGVATYTMFHEPLTTLPSGQGLDLTLEAMTAFLRFSEYSANQAETESDPAIRRFKEFYMGAMIAPYREGLRFVRALTASGESEWAAIDEAYRAKPPASTEQILHPEKYLAGETPEEVDVPDLSKELGDGWRLVETNHMGELQARLWLRLAHGQSAMDEGLQSALSRVVGGRGGFLGEFYRERVAARSPVEMAAGWAGDTYRVYAREGARPAIVWRTRWDGERDAEEFLGGANLARAFYTMGVDDPTYLESTGRTVDLAMGLPDEARDAVREALIASR